MHDNLIKGEFDDVGWFICYRHNYKGVSRVDHDVKRCYVILWIRKTQIRIRVHIRKRV